MKKGIKMNLTQNPDNLKKLYRINMYENINVLQNINVVPNMNGGGN